MYVEGSLNEYPQHVFCGEISKNNNTFELKKSALSHAMEDYTSAILIYQTAIRPQFFFLFLGLRRAYPMILDTPHPRPTSPKKNQNLRFKFYFYFNMSLFFKFRAEILHFYMYFC